jgi:hypothetical protein
VPGRELGHQPLAQFRTDWLGHQTFLLNTSLSAVDT